MSSAYDIVMENRREIVDKLIAQMEKGYAATRAAWNSGATGRPYNPVSDAVYKGGNRFRLMIAAEENGFTDPRWLTYKQASENNYRIAAGSKGVLLEKWIFYKEVPKLDEAQKPVIGADGKPEMERQVYKKPIVYYFRVFNGSQIIGLPELEHREVTEDAFSQMADTFEKSSLCPVGYEEQDRAYYSLREDRIHLPPKESFKNNEARLSVLLHEMAHSTGHESRLNRPLGNGFGSEAYAKEELKAELSSVFLENELGIEMEPDSELIKDHANYVKSWISVLRNDPNELFNACATADQITEFLMGNYERQAEQSMEMDKLTLEDRYTEAMKMLGYERMIVAEDELATVAFKNMETADVLKFDGWQTVGEHLEENAPLNETDAVHYDELIHPRNRLLYYTHNGGTRLGEGFLANVHESFEEAFRAYTESGLMDGKTLGFEINGKNPLPLVWYDAVDMENVLYRAADPTMRYASEATQNELKELRKNMSRTVDYLQKENVYVKLMQSVTEFEMKAMPAIMQSVPEEITKEVPAIENMTARFASDLRPQDYFEIRLLDYGYTIYSDKVTRNAVVSLRTVHGNEIVNEKGILVSSDDIAKNGINAFTDTEFAEWLHQEVINMDTDHMPYGQTSFTFYAPWGTNRLEEHYEKLENAGYDRHPSEEQYLAAKMESIYQKDAEMEQHQEKPSAAIESVKELPVGWEWQCFGDGSGCLKSPDRKSYFSYEQIFDADVLNEYMRNAEQIIKEDMTNNCVGEISPKRVGELLDSYEVGPDKQAAVDYILQNRNTEEVLDLSERMYCGLRFSGDMQHIDFSNAKLLQCSLCNVELMEADLYRTAMHNTRFLFAYLKDVNMKESTMFGADVDISNIYDCDLTKATIKDSVFRKDCFLKNNNFMQTNIDNTHFYNQKQYAQKNLEYADITLGGATLEEVDKYQREVKRALESDRSRNIGTDIENEARIVADIEKYGFRAKSDLVSDIIRFEQLEGRNYTLKELAELKRKNPQFKGHSEKAECFEKIIAECQVQEKEMSQNKSQGMEQLQKSCEKGAFLKQEMMMEQMQITPV